MTEPSPNYDPGPYYTPEQARAQADAILHGIPIPETEPAMAGQLLLTDALIRAGITVTPTHVMVGTAWEAETKQTIAATLPIEAVQLIASWIVRATLANHPRGDPRPSITCPVCRRTSRHPDDVSNGYCGNCRAFTSDPDPLVRAAEQTAARAKRDAGDTSGT